MNRLAHKHIALIPGKKCKAMRKQGGWKRKYPNLMSRALTQALWGKEDKVFLKAKTARRYLLFKFEKHAMRGSHWAGWAALTAGMQCVSQMRGGGLRTAH